MAKRYDKNDKDKRLERTITRNWIICGASLAAIIVLYTSSKGGCAKPQNSQNHTQSQAASTIKN